MPIVVNTNSAATSASFNLSKANDALRKSLSRLSSGNRITNPAEDAGGLAVAYKLDSHTKRTEAVLNNHQNALSYLQLQDGALQSVGDMVSRMAELRTMAADITKNTGDIENYSKEFRELQTQLRQVAVEKFNGIALFSDESSNATTLGVSTATQANEEYEYSSGNKATFNKWNYELLTHPSGQSSDGSISLNVVNIEFLTSLEDTTGVGGSTTSSNTAVETNLFANLAGIMNDAATRAAAANLTDTDSTAANNTDAYLSDIADVSIEQFTHIIQKVADARAENGAEQQRILSSYNLHSQNLVNLEAARGRIMDADIALESTRFARQNVLVQASASMTAQANQLTNVALTLLQ
jgi:flagellin